MICKYEVLKKIKLNFKYQQQEYLNVKLDFNKINYEIETYKINMELQKTPCRCSKCNPYTGN